MEIGAVLADDPSMRQYILIGKQSELYKYVVVGVQTCCCRIKVIGAALSSDISSVCYLAGKMLVFILN